NADKFKELGIAPPDRYRSLVDPRLTGRVGVPDIAGGLGLFVVYGFALVAGDIWANFMGSSWAIRLRRAGNDWAKFALLKVGDDVGIWERGHMGLAKDSRHVEAAHWFVNQLISPAIQLELAKR